MTTTTPPDFRLGVIRGQGRADGLRPYVACSEDAGDRPAVVLADSAASAGPCVREIADSLANNCLQGIPALAGRHPHQIDWYVTSWLSTLDTGGTSPGARVLEALTFRLVASEAGRQSYRVWGPVFAPAEGETDALLRGLEAGYRRIRAPDG